VFGGRFWCLPGPGTHYAPWVDALSGSKNPQAVIDALEVLNRDGLLDLITAGARPHEF
jgi:hypothetical protein